MSMERLKNQGTTLAAAAAIGLGACSSEKAPPDSKPAVESIDPAVPGEEEKKTSTLEDIKEDANREELVEQLLGTGLYQEKYHEQFGSYILDNFGNPEIASLQERYALGAMEWMLSCFGAAFRG